MVTGRPSFVQVLLAAALPASVLSSTLLLTAPVGALAQPSSDSDEASSEPSEPSRRLRIVRRSQAAFGTTVQIMAAAHTDVDARLVTAQFEAAFGEIRRVDHLLDERRPGSALFRVNEAAGTAPVVVDPEVFQLLTEALRVAKLSQGAFDPTFAAFTGVWRFSPDDPPSPKVPESALEDGGEVGRPVFSAPTGSPPRVPPAELREVFRSLVSYRELVLDSAARTAFLTRPGMKLSLRGMGKGYALDKAASVLQGRGVSSFVIAAGGDLVVRGDKEGKPWMVGIQDPRAPGHFAAFEALPGAVMTTGDYERSFFEGGKRYHHIIDPRTGAPAAGCRSVSLLAGDGLSADALSTAVFVLGPREGMKLVERLHGAEAIIVTDDNRVLISKGIRDVVKYRPPTDAP